MARVVLIHPPGGDPRSPRLALPTLAGYLRARDIDTRLVDLDIESVHGLLSRPMLTQAAAVLTGSLRRPADDASRRLTALAETLPETVPAALATLRDPTRFYDPHAHAAARGTLLDGMDLLSAASPRPVHWSFEPLRYDVDGVDATRLADLLEVTADPAANLFADFWADALLAELDSHRPSFVGISIALRFQWLPALMLARSLRQRGHFVALGGTLPPRFADRFKRLPDFFAAFADAIVVGDGESAMIELLEQVEGRRDLSRVPNCLYVERGQVRYTRSHLEDLATLPAPDFDGLPLDRYLVPEPVLPVLFGRGCYHGECRFCEIPHNNRISAEPFRLRPPERLVGDILNLAERWHCRHVVIGDEAVPPLLLKRILKGVRDAGRDDLYFSAYLRFERGFDAELCAELARGGLRRALLGLESACQETLDHMRKGIRIENVEPALAGLHAAKVPFLVFGLVGLPEESEASARSTFEYFERHAALFERPGNVFDIRPLELQSASPYMAQAEQFGLRLPGDELDADFVMGVGRRWQNTRGLTHDEVDRLFAEYIPRLEACTGEFEPWPVWDEWALLYGAHYDQRPYRYRRALPEQEGERVRLQLNPTVAVLAAGGQRQLVSRAHTVTLSASGLAALEAAGAGTSGEIVARLADPARSSATRAFVASLARAGLLEIVPLDAAPLVAAPRALSERLS